MKIIDLGSLKCPVWQFGGVRQTPETNIRPNKDTKPKELN